MQSPLLYEINTRCWLRELSASAGAPATLANVPDAEFATWHKLGFTHIWLMGAWSTGLRARAEALNHSELRKAYDQVLPGWTEADVPGSPYAIGDYRVPEALGGEAGLSAFRQRLQAYGMKLVLDFVPNHLGLDHPWVKERPEIFVHGPAELPGTFMQQTPGGRFWIAHGKDPYFPAWSDVAQVDYRRPAARDAMTELLQSVASRCDGVRCDMAMLLLNDVFARTWERFPATGQPLPEEFWPGATTAVRKAHPGFVFLAEAYWGLEPRLQAMGFDYTYDKTLYDRIVWRDVGGVQRHLLGLGAQAVAASAHFLENHDEPRIAGILSAPEHRAAALLILALPGMRFLYDGQLYGARVRVPVQLARRPVEPCEPTVKAIYEQWLELLPSTAIGRGQCEVLKPDPAWTDNPTAQDFVVLQWQDQEPAFDLVVVNLANHRSQCCTRLTVPHLAEHDWSMVDLAGSEKYQRPGAELQSKGLYLDLPAYGAQVFRLQPSR